MPLILPKTLKNSSFIIFFRKKVYCGNIQCFLFDFWWKQWNKQKIIKNLSFLVKRNFFCENAYIPFFWTEIKMVVDKTLILQETLETGYFMQFWEKKMNCQEKLIYFLLFSSFSFKTWKWKEKNTKKSFFLKKYIFFFEMVCITFYVTWKRDFLQNGVQTNKKV